MSTDQPLKVSMEEITVLCKKRGFVYPSSEIYGGIRGFYDYGPLGVKLKNNLRDTWWNDMVKTSPIGPDGKPLNIVGLDSALIQHPDTWKASGHLDGFADMKIDCNETSSWYRADHLEILVPKAGDGPLVAVIEGTGDKAVSKRLQKISGASNDISGYERISFDDLPVDELPKVVGPDAKVAGTLSPPSEFNLMFKTQAGPSASSEQTVYLRPETAQGIFSNYKNIQTSLNMRVPFGIAQVGSAFRNEITPRNYIFRTREFEQMELEWFCHPDEAPEWFSFWKENRQQWWQDLGINPENMNLHAHGEADLAHYAKEGEGVVDIEYAYPFSSPFGELEGIAHRVDFDLRQHQEHSRTRMEYRDPHSGEKYIPHVIEPSAGLNRGFLAAVCDAYTVDPERPSKMFMKFHPKLSPVKAAILPLISKGDMLETSEQLYLDLRKKFEVEHDPKQSIGKRYAKNDEIGTPFCITVDSDTATDQKVTIRNRDDMQQERIGIERVQEYLDNRLEL